MLQAVTFDVRGGSKASLRQVYEKNELQHWLAIYLGLSIIAFNVGAAFGLSEHEAVAIPLAILAIVMFVYFRRSRIATDIGLGVRANVSAPRMWFYLPLLLLVGLPLLRGIRDDLTIVAVTATFWRVSAT